MNAKIRMPSAAMKRRAFRELLASSKPIFAPGVYDGFGLRILERYEVDAAYISGNAVSACLLGEPDVGLVDLTLLADHLGRLNQCSRLPLICDADTGYGSVVNIRRTVRALEAAGVCAIHIEDQITPKRCAQLPGARAVLSHTEAVHRIAAACEARLDSDAPLVIVGRTDAAASLGLDAAIARAQDFIKAGAEAIFIELKSSPQLLDQIRVAAKALQAPCMVNMSIDTRLMALPAHDWLGHGVSIGIFPAIARASFGYALRANLDRLRSGDIDGLQHHSLSAQDYADILGINEIEQWEQQFGVDSPEAPPPRKP